jgi:CDP-diacylglycerol--glycerol-3-phosphate 3-phosphatidyltransferase
MLFLMKQIPNLITLFRLALLLPILLLLALSSGEIAFQRAFALFGIAAFLDAADGWVARRWNGTSPAGAFLDPLTDKITCTLLLVFLACRHPDRVSLWLVLPLIAREFAVQGFRSLGPCAGVLLRTDRLSKVKTLFQLISIGAVLAGLGWGDLAGIACPAAQISLLLAVGSGYLSLVIIFIRNADLWSRRPLPMEIR